MEVSCFRDTFMLYLHEYDCGFPGFGIGSYDHTVL